MPLRARPGAPISATPMTPITTTGTGLILGRVIDAGSGRPVPGALVAIGGSAPPAPVTRTMVRQHAGRAADDHSAVRATRCRGS